MPIVVAVLGVIIVIMGFVFFTSSPAEETAVVPDAPEMNRTEEMEKEPETVVDDESLADPVVSQDDSTAVIASTLTGKGTYQTPARTTHEIDVTLTVEAGIVTDAKVVYDNGEGFSNPNQERFDGAYKALVVGKSLNDISLSRVGGASLTTEAFNQALVSIKAQQSQ